MRVELPVMPTALFTPRCARIVDRRRYATGRRDSAAVKVWNGAIALKKSVFE